MAELPIRPHFKRRGRTSRTVQKVHAFNKMAQRIGDYLHKLILEDRARVQHYSYSEIGRALGLEPQQVEAAIGDGHYTGVTLFVEPAHRNLIASQLKPKSRMPKPVWATHPSVTTEHHHLVPPSGESREGLLLRSPPRLRLGLGGPAQSLRLCEA
jgi:hypothetical protein